MELSLDLSLAFIVPRSTVSELLGEASQSKDDDGSQKMTTRHEDLVKRLEDEMRKIEAFKRELPLCMTLVNDAITRLKEERDKCTRVQDEPVVEESLPVVKLGTSCGGNGSMMTIGKGSSDKKNWMSSAQLWNAETESRNAEDDRCVPHNPIHQPPRKETNNSGGPFLAFIGNSGVSKTVMMREREDKEVSEAPSLGLMTLPASDLNRGSSRSLVEIKGQPQPRQNNNPRKQRRCWSPELHRRFVDALQQLGGPQVATPKQIRELMQVEGLTNDEVKSHLQKYRLHFRRIPISPNGQANNGGILMAQDECGDKNNNNNNNNKLKGTISSQSGSPQGPLFLRGSSGKGISSASGRNSMDTEEEDEQSDCHSWKGGLHHPPLEAGVL